MNKEKIDLNKTPTTTSTTACSVGPTASSISVVKQNYCDDYLNNNKFDKNVNYFIDDPSASDNNNNDYDNYEDCDDGDDYYGNYEEDPEFYEENPYDDPEYYEYKCFYIKELKSILNEKCEKISELLDLKYSEANDLLKKFKFNYFKIVDLVKENKKSFVETYIKNSNKAATTESAISVSTVISMSSKLALISSKYEQCTICYEKKEIKSDMCCLDCMHLYCKTCWKTYFEHSIYNSNTSIFECMNSKCKMIANQEFILKIFDTNNDLCERYLKLCESDMIKVCEDFRHCPGIECNFIIWARPLARRVNCKSCFSQFCFLCTYSYHAPNSCETIRKWYIKCHDDSETRNYLLVHTQDCPACKVCIEKNGGCSHMTCNRCKHEFCWVCLNDWKTHGASYDCNRYKANPTQDQAREALNRYTHYYHRWINHTNSLKFEKEFKEKCDFKIKDKIMNGTCGTLVDWEFLIEAADILTKARYTLQYTYPYAYYLENAEIKLLFENIQAELEREVENLSHSLEKASLNDKYNIKTQMNIVEKRRKTLLKDFIK